MLNSKHTFVCFTDIEFSRSDMMVNCVAEICAEPKNVNIVGIAMRFQFDIESWIEVTGAEKFSVE